MKMFLTLTLMLFTGAAFAQVDMEQASSLLKPVLEVLLGFLPESAVAAIVLIGGLRVVFKPLMALLEAVSVYTLSKKDDEIYKNISEGNTYKTFKFVVDYIASIKLPEKK